MYAVHCLHVRLFFITIHEIVLSIKDLTSLNVNVSTAISFRNEINANTNTCAILHYFLILLSHKQNIK